MTSKIRSKLERMGKALNLGASQPVDSHLLSRLTMASELPPPGPGRTGSGIAAGGGVGTEAQATSGNRSSGTHRQASGIDMNGEEGLPLSGPTPGPRVIDTRFGRGTQVHDWSLDLISRSGTAGLPLGRIDPRVSTRKVQDLLFIDTETTGLSGGAGTLAFLVGLAYVEDDRVIVEQRLLHDFPDESEMLVWLTGHLTRCRTLISYNGKAFDMPLLESRRITNRFAPWPAAEHLDLLFITRRLYGRRLDDCSLKSIERSVLDLHRTEDIPSHLIPDAYFRFVRDRDDSRISGIIDHNRQDLLSLVGILKEALDRVEEETLIEHQVDIFSLGMHLEKIGDTVGAIDSYRRARAEGRGSTRYRSSHRLATLLRKVGDREGAAGVWESLIREYPSHGPVAYEEFAKHLEHGTGDHGHQHIRRH